MVALSCYGDKEHGLSDDGLAAFSSLKQKNKKKNCQYPVTNSANGSLSVVCDNRNKSKAVSSL